MSTNCLCPQTILCGMGELHIEIIHDRIRREYGIETHLGPLQVAYRESILNEVSATGTTNSHFLIFALGFVRVRNNSGQLRVYILCNPPTFFNMMIKKS